MYRLVRSHSCPATDEREVAEGWFLWRAQLSETVGHETGSDEMESEVGYIAFELTLAGNVVRERTIEWD